MVFGVWMKKNSLNILKDFVSSVLICSSVITLSFLQNSQRTNVQPKKYAFKEFIFGLFLPGRENVLPMFALKK